MIIKVNTNNDCKVCDYFLTRLIQDERQYDNTIDENFVVKDYFINMINNGNILLLYKKSKIDIGYIFVKRINNEYLIDGLYVDINYRNNGIATKLIKEAIKEINLLGKFKITINVLKQNKDAIHLYKTIGFVIEKDDENRYYLKYSKEKI